MLLSSSEDAHITDDEATGVKIIRVNTATAESLDKTVPTAERHMLFDVGYSATAAALKPFAGYARFSATRRNCRPRIRQANGIFR